MKIRQRRDKNERTARQEGHNPGIIERQEGQMRWKNPREGGLKEKTREREGANERKGGARRQPNRWTVEPGGTNERES